MINFTQKKNSTKKLIKKFLKESLKGLKVNTIITDGFTAYNEIIEEIGAKHQTCTFHLMQNLMTPLNKFINKRERSIKSLKNKITENEKKNKQIKNKNNSKKRQIPQNRQQNSTKS